MTPQDDPIIPYGYCHCGCGRPTNLTKQANTKKGYTNAQPFRFIRGHNARGVKATPELRLKQSKAQTVHGHARHLGVRSSTYVCWHSMIQRCHDQNCKYFKNYGGRGIIVCERWRNSFQAFLEDMGEHPDGMTIERKDNNSNYEPGNCKWATYTEQANNRRSNRLIEYDGSVYTLQQLSDKCGVHRATISSRIEAGRSIEDAIKR